MTDLLPGCARPGCGQESCARVHMVNDEAGGHDFVSAPAASPTYAHVGYLPPQVMDDAPRLEAMLAHFRREAAEGAAADGYRLSEDFTVQQKPTVWVEDWSEFGGAYVAPEVAAVVGVVGDEAKPGPIMVLHEWQIVGDA